MATGYENIYSGILPRLAELDIVESAVRLGLDVTEGGALVSFLSREYIISGKGVEPKDGGTSDVNNRSVLAHYILSDSAGEPSNEFVQLGRLLGSLDGQYNQSDEASTVIMVKEFGADNEKLNVAVARLGGQKLAASGTGKHVWQLLPLPKIPVRIVKYDADEEFPVDIQMLFDKTAPRFLNTETLGYLLRNLVLALVEASR